MTKTLWMLSRRNYNLNANKDFVIFRTSKLITCFIGCFTLTMKPQSIAQLFNYGSEHIYLILDLECEVHSVWDLWISGLKNARAMSFFSIGRVGSSFRSGLENTNFLDERLPLPDYDTPKSSWGGVERPVECPHWDAMPIVSIHDTSRLGGTKLRK